MEKLANQEPESLGCSFVWRCLDHGADAACIFTPGHETRGFAHICRHKSPPCIRTVELPPECRSCQKKCARFLTDGYGRTLWKCEECEAIHMTRGGSDALVPDPRPAEAQP